MDEKFERIFCSTLLFYPFVFFVVQKIDDRFGHYTHARQILRSKSLAVFAVFALPDLPVAPSGGTGCGKICAFGGFAPHNHQTLESNQVLIHSIKIKHDPKISTTKPQETLPLLRQQG